MCDKKCGLNNKIMPEGNQFNGKVTCTTCALKLKK